MTEKKTAAKKKTRKVNFTVTDSVYLTWQHVAEDLLSRRVFRSRTEIFETMTFFLQRAKKEEIGAFKSSSMII